jgi:ABC-type multidrug transport system permease subunit
MWYCCAGYPRFRVVIPGLISDWAKVIPSYYLIDAVNRAVNYSAGWGEVGGSLAVLAAISAALIAGGLVALRRRFQ